MYAVTVMFNISPAHRAAACRLMHENAQASLGAEAGCKPFDVCADPERPDVGFLPKPYRDSAAFDRHPKNPHFKALEAAGAEMIMAQKGACFTRLEQ